uniref:LRRCT domain-containing protein n=1 Tax=Gopherus agassizii TaxID=38772 RepID=A0A452IRL0_9SAUR
KKEKPNLLQGNLTSLPICGVESDPNGAAGLAGPSLLLSAPGFCSMWALSRQGLIPHSTWLLDLRHNNLTSLEAGSFDTLWSMKILLLAHNSVGQLWPKAFTCLGFLEKIDLSHNLLAQLPPDFSDELLAGNPWACDCDLQRVFSKILSVHHLHVEDYTNITCASPWQLAGRCSGWGAARQSWLSAPCVKPLGLVGGP